MTLGLERISGTVKALWAIVTIVVSIVTAIASSAIYIHDLKRDVDDLKTAVSALEMQVKNVSQQLKPVSPVMPPIGADFNGTGTPLCNNGSFMVGLRFGVDPNLNPHGTILCAKVQPEIE